MSLLVTARFAITVVQISKLPRTPQPEVAFVGRSNAGKSSAINILCNRKRLAFASRTPGRTQALNLFALGPVDEPSAYLVDTPGYGYAAVPLAEKRQWDQLAGNYLRVRESLAGVVLMADIRRGITEMDAQLIGWIPLSVPLMILLTKCDKLSRQQQTTVLRDIQGQMGVKYRMADVQLFSSSNRIGLETATEWITGYLKKPVTNLEAHLNMADASLIDNATLTKDVG